MRTATTPRRGRCAVLASMAFTLLAWAPPAHGAVPVPDAVFYGSVTVGSVPATSGFIVRARIGSEVLATYVVGENAVVSGYLLRIPMQQATASGESRPQGFGFEASTVTFTVGTGTATTATLEGGSLTQLNLTVVSGGPTPPTLTPTPVTPPTNTPRATTPAGGTPGGATPTRTQTRTGTPAASPTPTATGGACVGDCNGSIDVTVDEILTMVSVALGSVSVEGCPPGDTSGDGAITVDELLSAVTNALRGCL